MILDGFERSFTSKLKARADINAANPRGETPLLFASHRGGLIFAEASNFNVQNFVSQAETFGNVYFCKRHFSSYEQIRHCQTKKASQIGPVSVGHRNQTKKSQSQAVTARSDIKIQTI